MRVLAYKLGDEVRLDSRRLRDVTGDYPGLVQALAGLPHDLILDGEVVALDEDGRPSFQRLQRQQEPLHYYVFDVLWRDGADLRQAPLEDRLNLLPTLLPDHEPLRIVPSFPEHGQQVMESCLQLGFEGVVAKQRGSRYEAGKRSRSWVKIKPFKEETFLIGGYTEGSARGRSLGALLLGRARPDGTLEYMGHTGIGLSDELQRELRQRLEPLRRDSSPFTPRPGLQGRGRPVWTEPEFLAEVRYSVLTEKARRLREPVFVSLRPRDSPEVELLHPERPLSLLEQLETEQNTATLMVEGSSLRVSALKQHIWPGYTKLDLLRYFVCIAPLLLPHLRDRPLMLVRYPKGVGQARLRTKSADDLELTVPEFVQTAPVHSETRGTRPYVLCQNLATLLWLAEIYALELHVWLSRITRHPDALHLPEHQAEERGVLNYPDALLFDIDPYVYSGQEQAGQEPEWNPRAWKEVAQVARQLKQLLDELALPALVKSSGKTGLHVLVPVTRRLDFHATRYLSRSLCERLARQNSKVTLAWAIEQRRDKIFLDANQNTYGKTMASIYSPRAVAGGWVSVPLDWDELDQIDPTEFTLHTVPERFPSDPWHDFLLRKTELIEVLRRVR